MTNVMLDVHTAPLTSWTTGEDSVRLNGPLCMGVRMEDSASTASTRLTNMKTKTAYGARGCGARFRCLETHTRGRFTPRGWQEFAQRTRDHNDQS